MYQIYKSFLWHRCIRDVKHGVGKLLTFVNTVKRLADIRDAVWDLLSQDDSMADWDGMCLRVLNRKLSSWDDFLWGLFLDRVKVSSLKIKRNSFAQCQGHDPLL